VEHVASAPKTVERAAEIGLPVAAVPGWYDVDDAASLALLEASLPASRRRLPKAVLAGAAAPATRAHFAARAGAAARRSSR
jgi:hypothetical protein